MIRWWYSWTSQNWSLAVSMMTVIVFGIGISFALAVAKEPSSLWLWRDVLGFIN